MGGVTDYWDGRIARKYNLESALGHLADEQREILLLVALEDMSYADIATTLGIPIGMGVIVFTVLITAIYVRRANNEFDALTSEILKDAAK